MLTILRAKKGKKKEYNYPLCINNDNKDESPFHCDPTKEHPRVMFPSGRALEEKGYVCPNGVYGVRGSSLPSFPTPGA